MRIVGGSMGGRRYNAPASLPARPTTDMAREALMNILNNSFPLAGLSTLDLFSGTGSLVYEMASAGVTSATAVELDATSIAFIKKTIIEFKIEDIVSPIKADVFKFLDQCQNHYDLVTADPPYAHPAMAEMPNLIMESAVLKTGGWLVLEHDRRHKFADHPMFLRAKKYGDSYFSFFEAS